MKIGEKLTGNEEKIIINFRTANGEVSALATKLYRLYGLFDVKGDFLFLGIQLD